MQQQLIPSKWLIYWIFMPVVSLLASAGAFLVYQALLSLYLFPILLVIGQWYALKCHPANHHPTYWFLIIPVFGLSLGLAPILSLLHLLPMPFRTETFGVTIFYLSQCLAERILVKMFSTWRSGWHTAANSMAFFSWYLFFLSTDYTANHMARSWWNSDVGFPVLFVSTALLANLLTGLGLFKATQAN